MRCAIIVFVALVLIPGVCLGAPQATPTPHPLAGQQYLQVRPDVPVFTWENGTWIQRGLLSRPLGFILLATETGYQVQTGGQQGWVRKDDVVLLSSGPRIVAVFTEQIRQNPRNAFAYRQRAIARSELSPTEYDGAFADLDQAIRLEPNQATHFLHRGLLFYFKKQYPQSLADFDQAIRLDSAFAHAFHWRAHVHGITGNRSRAIADAEEAIRLEPNNPQPYAGRANQYLNLGRRDEGFADLDKAIALQPNLAEHYATRAEWRGALGDATGAVRDLEAAIACEPGIARWYGERARLRLTLGQVTAALADLDTCKKLNPEHSFAYLARMQILLSSGQRDAALQTANEAVAACRDKAELHGRRGQLFEERGDHRGARADFEKAVQLAPTDVTWRRALAEILAMSPDASVRDSGRAITEATRLIELTGGNDPELLHRVAFYCTLAGRNEDAERWKKRAAQGQPNLGKELPPLPKP